jgi:hypothetical protein
MKLPFKNMTRESRQNFVLIIAVSVYITLFGIVFIHSDMCNILGADYCAFWSGGRIINERSIADVYDLNVLTQYQMKVYSQVRSSSTSFEVFPLPYLPVFILPFQLLSLIHLPYSYLVWTIINLLGFMLYLGFFSRKLIGRSLSTRLSLLIILSLPMITNVREGQLNIWLGICAGEFLRATLSGKHKTAGFWLGGWLLKPQLLLLMFPFLLIQRSFKILIGFIVAALAFVIVSLGLIGIDGFTNLADIILRSSQGNAASYPQYMMNWRMLGWHLASVTTPSIGLALSIIGSVMTISAALFYFRKPLNRDPIKTVLAFLGVCAATSAAAWHAHVHTAIILIPPIIYLLMKNDFNKKLFLSWVIVPTLILLLGYILSVLMEVGLVFTSVSDQTFIKALGGLSMFIFNLIVFGWAIVQYNFEKQKPNPVDLY